jgi:hypothetical protein
MTLSVGIRVGSVLTNGDSCRTNPQYVAGPNRSKAPSLFDMTWLPTAQCCWIWPDKCKILLDTGMLHDHGISVADRHRFGANPDPNFHVDANPDPPDWHQNDADPHADPTQNLHLLDNKKNIFYFWQCCGSGSVGSLCFWASWIRKR